jgi:hypothetical protein
MRFVPHRILRATGWIIACASRQNACLVFQPSDADLLQANEDLRRGNVNWFYADVELHLANADLHRGYVSSHCDNGDCHYVNANLHYGDASLHRVNTD